MRIPYLQCFGGDKKKPTDTPTTAETEGYRISAEERAKRDKLINGTQPALKDFYTLQPNGETRFQHALKVTGLESTNRAYEAGETSQRQKANMAGFGYTSPTAVGSDEALENEKDRELARVPVQAKIDATGPEFTAIGLTNQQASQYQGAPYFGAAAGAESNRLNDSTKLYMDEQQRRAGLWKALSKVGLMGASFIPGVGPVAAGALQGMSGAV